MKKPLFVQAPLASVVLVTLLVVHPGAFAQGSAQSATPANAATLTQQRSDETLSSAFGPISLAALAVMTLLVRRRPMR